MWISCNTKEPEQGKTVNTCIMDNKGQRNEQLLKLKGNLWFFPDMSMYVYYTPTHWKENEKLP
jgi:hypothetical protein